MDKEKPARKKRPVLIELPQDYIDKLSKIANKENRSMKAQAEVIVMRFLEELNGFFPLSRGSK